MHTLHMHRRLGLGPGTLNTCKSDIEFGQLGHPFQTLLDILCKALITRVLWLIAGNVACLIESILTARFVLPPLFRTCH